MSSDPKRKPEPSIDPEASEWGRWINLVYCADLLEERGASGAVDLPRILRVLDSVEEVFPKSLDPVEDIEAFAVRRFCKALREALAAQPPKPSSLSSS